MLAEMIPQGVNGLVAGQDFSVAAWTFKEFGIPPLFIKKGYGIVRNGQLVGGAIFHEWNSINVIFSYWTKSPLTRNEFAILARVAVEELGVERVTIHIPRTRKRWGKYLLKLGAKVEGTLWRFYGRTMESRYAAVQYVLFKEQLLRIAGVTWRRRKMN